YWYDRLIGSLVHEGDEIIWAGQSPQYFKIFDVADETQEPAVIKNLEPEGWLSNVLDYRSQWPYLEEGLCFLSNIRIVAPQHKEAFLALAPKDVLKGRIENFCREDGVFSGTYEGPSGNGVMLEMAKSVAAFWQDKTMPRLSGAQMKLPMCLHQDGRLVPALGEGDSFTHLLKLPGSDKLGSLGALEWLSLRVAEKVGIETSKHALVSLPDGLPPTLMVERFDIPETPDDSRKILMQDFCSLAKIPSHQKNEGSVESCAKLLKGISTDWVKDRESLFDRVVLSYALRDGDMHRKNLSVLKTIEGCDPQTLTVRLSPAYDIVNTIVFQEKDEMALTLNGKRERLDRKTWEYLGKTLGMESKDAGDRAMRLIGDVAAKAVEIARSLPPEIAVHPSCVHMIERAVTETVDLAKRNGLQTPPWDSVYDQKEKPTREQAKYAKRQAIRVKMGLEYREDNPFSALAPDF
ncbi:MAG TPA: HipA domain-containing protein, partial [Alphaproteobacteria bacterium]|nr:HipA domain-containing protein [Alphaproteobacteria bacterium]